MKVSPDERISFEDYFNHKFFKEKDDFIQNFKYQNDKIKKIKKKIKKDNINKIYNIAESFIDIMIIPNGEIDQKNINIKMANIIYYDEILINI